MCTHTGVAVVQSCINSYINNIMVYAPHVSDRQYSNCTCDERNAIIIVFYNADWIIQVSRMNSDSCDFEFFFATKSCTFLKLNSFSSKCHDAMTSWHCSSFTLFMWCHCTNFKWANKQFEYCPAIWLSNAHDDFWHVCSHLNNKLDIVHNDCFAQIFTFSFQLPFSWWYPLYYIKSMSLFCPLLV